MKIYEECLRTSNLNIITSNKMKNAVDKPIKEGKQNHIWKTKLRQHNKIKLRNWEIF